jgi:hypothetical protein
MRPPFDRCSSRCVVRWIKLKERLFLALLHRRGGRRDIQPPPSRSAPSSNMSYAATNGLQVEVKGAPDDTSPPPSPCCHSRSSTRCCLGGDGGRSNGAGAGFVSFAPRGKIRHRISIAICPRLKRQRGGAGRGLGCSRRVGRFTTPRLTHTPRCSCLAPPPSKMRRRWRW